jgi:hypothetical protein
MERTEELKLQLNNYIVNFLKEDKFKENIKNLLVEEIKNGILSRREEFLHTDTYKSIKSKIKADIAANIKTRNFKEDLSRFIDKNFKTIETSNRTLDTIIPPAVINSLKVYIYNNKDEIVAVLKNFLSSDKFDKKVHEEISKVINSFGPMVSRFINAGSIQSKLKTSINEFLENSNNLMDIINAINAQIDLLMKKKISDLANNFPAEGRRSLINSISDGILNEFLSEKFIDMAINMIEDRLVLQVNKLSNDDENFSDKLFFFISYIVDEYFNKIFIEEKANDIVYEFSSGIVDNILSKPLIELI